MPMACPQTCSSPSPFPKFSLTLGASALLAVALAGCEKPQPPKATAPPPPAPARHVSVLVTGHETGHLVTDGPRLLAQWSAQEKWPDVIALSTGDVFSGLAVSSHFLGEPSAEAAKALQYRAAALGNHDLDLGLDTLKNFRTRSGLTLLAANLRDKPGAEQPLGLAPYTVIERGGIKVGVVGLTSSKTILTTVAGRASGLELIPTEAALPPALEGVKKAGAEVVVVLVDDCFDTVSRAFEGHPEWVADLVVGSRCEGPNEAKVRTTPFFSVGDDLSHYVSAAVEVSASGARTVRVTRRALDTKGPEDADMAALRDRWQKRLDEHLGQVIAFSKGGVTEESELLRTWVATALKMETKSDAALINRKGVRAALPKGPITRAHVYSMIPFENAVLTVKVKGEALEKLKANPEAVLALPAGKLVHDKEYQLATTEYLYFGGDGLGLEAFAPEPELTGQVWQTPVIAWFEKLGSTEKRPLEKAAK